MFELGGLTDEMVRSTILRAIRILVVITVIAVPIVWWKFGWASAALLLVGAAISGTGLWEWKRVMMAVAARMDAGGEARPMGAVLAGFFLRLGLIFVVLYVSLKYLDGSVYALVAGLGLGVAALTFEALRLLKSWTM